jgi:SAM-dependent methyltransferase
MEDRMLRTHVVLKGTTLDLGSGDSDYVTELRREGAIFPVTVDLRHETSPDVVANFEAGLPFRDGSIDTVLLHNVLEHVSGHEELIAEIGRVLAPGGTLYMSMPFLMPVHERHGATSYRDYRRLTAAALERLLAAFTAVHIETAEVGPFVAAFHIAFSAIPLRVARGALAGVAWTADALYARLRRRRDPETHITFALGYVAIAQR